jgi:hypothetical protein
VSKPISPLWNRPPWDSPTFIPGAPHNLPAPGDRLKPRTGNLVGGQAALADAPYNPEQFVIPVRERHRYANVIELVYTIPVTSFQVLQEPPGLRNFLFFRNASTVAATLRISFGNQASAQSLLSLTQGQQVLFDTVVPQNEVFVISDIVGGLVVVGYSNFSPN